MRLILFVILWMGLRFIIASQQKKRKTPKKMTQSQEPALQTMDVPDMVSEPMEAETMTAENMEAEPMIAEKIGTEDGLSLDLEEEYLPVTAGSNPWKGKISKKNIRTGFIMAQLLAKPRSLNPYHYE
jgi:hypothetical protein